MRTVLAVLSVAGAFFHIFHKNNDAAQYSNNNTIIIFTTFPCLLNNILNNEPNNAQHIVPVNPINVSKSAKNSNMGISL
jgi:hypothetical protein